MIRPPRCVVYRYQMDLPYGVDDAFQWLTDYSDDDPSRTTAIVKRRPVVKRTEDRVVLDGEIEIMGRKTSGRAIVHLHPPDRWVATFPDGKGTEYHYRLTPRADGGSRLHVEYRMRVRRWKGWLLLNAARPAARRELDRMWQGFAASMREDLGAPGTKAPRA